MLASVSAAGHVSAQGRDGFLNVESPQVSPIAHVQVTSPTNVLRRLVLVCNTPNNSVELWDTDEALAQSARLRDRCAVGLEPVSVLVSGDKFWTANFLGDSVTAGRIQFVGNQPRLQILETNRVGDEPMDMARLDFGGVETLVVTLHSRSAVSWIRADTLEPLGGTSEIRIQDPLMQPPPPTRFGLKEPRAIRVVNNKLHVLGMKGGATHPNSMYDVDMFIGTPSGSVGSPMLTWSQRLGGLGSTNFNMRVANNGDLFVVGGEARSFDLDGLPAIIAQNSGGSGAPGSNANQTGFVASTIYRVQPSAGTFTVQRRDLNQATGGGSAVAKDIALAQPTDVALLEDAAGVNKVFIAAMGSDRIGVLVRPTAGNNDITTWQRKVIDYTPVLPSDPAGAAKRYGPRGMVLGRNQAGALRLYVVNRIDNSVTIIDPNLETVRERFPLSVDPTPAHVKGGRHWLYSAQLSSSGYVSCASCHPDGRTDALAWRLGNPTNAGTQFPPIPHDKILRLAGTGSFAQPLQPVPAIPAPQNLLFQISDPLFFTAIWWSRKFGGTGWPPPAQLLVEDKREMVTQSLQGLSNWEVDPTGRDLFSNAPYHWRGDRLTVGDFEEGFVNLLGAAPMSGAQKREMEQFVLSISYPPNPKQDRSRTYSGDAAEGLALFHTQKVPALGNRSCSTCHELPEGSNNRLTVLVNDNPIQNFIATTNRQGIESAALRGLFQKEPVWELDGSVDPSSTSPRIGQFGMNHNGIQPLTAGGSPTVAPTNLTTINTFIDVFFVPGSSEGKKVKQFVHEMDWGVAPIIGWVTHVRQPEWIAFNNPPSGTTYSTMVGQVHEANAGMVVWVQLNSPALSRRGFRYFPNGTFYEEPQGTTPFTLEQIHALMSNAQDSITFLAVPLGSERRIASPTGTAANFQQVAPGVPTFVDLHANTAYAGVPFLTGVLPAPAGDPVGSTKEVYAETIKLFQDELKLYPAFKLPNSRHEAPRRLRVRGTGINLGAKLLIGIPDPNLPAHSAPGSTPRIKVALELHPTAELVNGERVWETAAELDPFQLYQLMLGGPTAPGVENAIVNTIVTQYGLTNLQMTLGMNSFYIEALGAFPALPMPSTTQFQPMTWNWYPIEIRNPGPAGPGDPTGPVSPLVWQQLVLGS